MFMPQFIVYSMAIFYLLYIFIVIIPAPLTSIPIAENAATKTRKRKENCEHHLDDDTMLRYPAAKYPAVRAIKSAPTVSSESAKLSRMEGQATPSTPPGSPMAT